MICYTRFLALLTALALICLGCAAAEQRVAEYDRNNPGSLTPEHLYAQSALLVDEDSGEVLFSKDSRVRMYPASTTKIMTLLLALESGIPLDGQVTVPPEAAQIPEGSSVIPVQPGDVLSFRDLLYGFMLSSGNDGANAIAVLVDGDIQSFVQRMNERAAAMGCEGTHFVNAHGYHDAGHYTTAQDLAIMAREAMKNEEFRKIVASPAWTVAINRGGEDIVVEIVSRNSLLQSDQKYYYPECTGIKTGHHNKAGWCFVGSAERDGMRVICVVLNCEQENDKWYDAAKLFEYGFTRYSTVTAGQLLEQAREEFARVALSDADEGDPEGGSLLMNLEGVENGDAGIRVISGSEAAMAVARLRAANAVQIEWTRPLKAPVAEGERMGTLALTLPDGSRVSAGLTASRSVAAKPDPTPTRTADPTPSATIAEAQTQPDPKPSADNRLAIAMIALLVLLALACVFIAVAIRRAARRRARRRRRQGRRAVK